MVKVFLILQNNLRPSGRSPSCVLRGLVYVGNYPQGGFVLPCMYKVILTSGVLSNGASVRLDLVGKLLLLLLLLPLVIPLLQRVQGALAELCHARFPFYWVCMYTKGFRPTSIIRWWGCLSVCVAFGRQT